MIENSQSVVRLAHEIILNKCKKASDIINEDKEFLIIRSRLEPYANHWYNENKPETLLLNPDENHKDVKNLADAKSIWEKNREKIDKILIEYIEASMTFQTAREDQKNKNIQEEQDKRFNEILQEIESLKTQNQIELKLQQNYYKNILKIASGFAVVLLGGISGLYFYQQSELNHKLNNVTIALKTLTEKRYSDLQFLATISREATEKGDPIMGMRLALQALDVNHSDSEIESALYRAVLACWKSASDECQNIIDYKSIRFKNKTDVQHVDFNLGKYDNFMIAVSTNGVAHLHDIDSGWDIILQPTSSENQRRLNSQKYVEDFQSVNDVTFSHDGKFIATASVNGIIYLWKITDVDFTNKKPTYSLIHSQGARYIAFNPRDNHSIITLCKDGKAYLWNIDKGKKNSIPLPDQEISHVAFSHDGKRIATVSAGQVHVRTIDGDRIESSESPPTLPHPQNVDYVAFNPADANQVVTLSNGKVKLWNIRKDKSESSELVYEVPIKHVIFSHKGEFIATTSNDHKAQLWKLENLDRPDKTLEGHKGEIKDIAFSPDDKHVITASADNTARLWNITGTEGTELAVLDDHRGSVEQVAFNRDGSYIATISANEVRLWPHWSDVQELVKKIRSVLASPSEILRSK